MERLLRRRGNDLINKMDNFLVFALTMVLIVTASQRLLGAGAAKIGWNGVANFFR